MQEFPRYGIYQATALLGRGGMGSVYLAERADGAYTQRVAIKVLAQHLGGEDFEARFRVERQLLAQMNHPNIVRLLDGGIADSGEAFLVTEYVDGVSLDKYCDEKKLRLPQRIALFLQVCAAVEHAHQNLIVHRDLKPSNVLVTREEGQVKLLDFGTAKLLKGPEEQAVTEVMLLTPRYASPEQLRKDPITTRSDVYSLGMVLYELLSGHRAFGDTAEVVQELARAYQYSEIRPLGQELNEDDASRRGMGMRELSRALEGDLGVICAKALEHEAGRRYATVRELASDLEAYLTSQPVKARPATFWYRAGKFLHRQRYAAVATLLVLFAGVAGLIGILREKSLAERRFEDVRRLARYQVFDLYDQMLEVKGTTKMRANMAAEALRYLNALAAEAAGNESLAIELALGYLRVGDVTGNFGMQSLGNWQEAVKSYERGLAVLAAFESQEAKRARTFLKYSATVAKNSLDPKDENLKTLETLVKDFEAILAANPRIEENYLRLGKAYQSVGRAKQRQVNASGLNDVSEAWTRRAKDTFEKGLVLNPDSVPLMMALHQAAGDRAGWLSQTQPQASLRWASEAEMWRKRVPEPARSSIGMLRDWASTLSARATALSSLDQQEEGRAEMLEALRIFESLATDTDNLAARMDLYTTLHNLALLEDEMGHEQDYLKVSERMLEIADDLMKRSPSPRVEYCVQSALYNLCYAYSGAKDPRANATLARTFALLEKKAAEQPKDAACRVTLADLLLNLAHPGYDDPAKALPFAKRITELAPEELNGWELLAAAHLQLKNYGEAVTALEKGISKIPAPKEGQQASGLYLKLQERLGRYREKLATAARQ